MYSKQLTLLLVIVASATAYAAKSEIINDINEQEKGELNFCQQCRSIVSFVSRFNASNARQDYKKIFESFCEQYYAPSTEFQQGPCPMFVEYIFYWIEKIDPINHCDQIGACGGAPALTQRQPIQPFTSNSIQTAEDGDGGVVCSVCEQVIQQIKVQFEDPNVERKLHMQVDALCDYLKVIKQDKQCEQVLNKNIADIISFIRQLDPLNYCKSIHMCTNNDATRNLQSRPQQKLPTLTDFNDFGIEVSVERGGQVNKDLENNNFSMGPNCVLCKIVIKEMFKFLKNNRTEEKIREGLDKICELVYHSHGDKYDQCAQLVAVYDKEIVELLTEETDPELVCMLLEQCTHRNDGPKTATIVARKNHTTTKVSSISMSQFISMLDSSIPVDSLRTCVECKLFVKYLQDSFEDEKTQEKLKQWLLTNLCASLGEQEMKDSCVELVNNYEEPFFKAVALQLDPQVVCLDLKACRPRRITHKRIDPPIVRQSQSIVTLNRVVPKLVQARTQTQVCETCIDIITKLDEYLSEHSIDEDVTVLIDNVCNKLGNPIARKECAVLVKNLGQDIAQAISTMDDPRQLCTKLQAC